MRIELTKQELISKIAIINAKEDKECILKVLNETDVRILKYIVSITVYDESKIPETITRNPSWGTIITTMRNGILVHNAMIHLVSSKFRSEDFFFEHTLKHELGHLCGWMKSPNLGNSENFSNDYAKDPEEALYREVTSSSLIGDIFRFIFG